MAIQYGVEFECKNLSVNDVREAMERAGESFYNQEGLLGYHTTVPDGMWKAERDGSLGASAGSTTKGYMEIISPVLEGEEGVRRMKRVARQLTKAGGKVDRMCGTHVTLGVNNNARWARFSENKKIKAGVNIQHIYAHFKNTLNAIQPDSRTDSRWSRIRNAGYTFTERYSAVNLAKWIMYGRVEFRQQGGTLDGDKVKFFLKIANAMVAASINENHASANRHTMNYNDNIDGLVNYLNLGEPVRRWLVNRVVDRLTVEGQARTAYTSRGIHVLGDHYFDHSQTILDATGTMVDHLNYSRGDDC